MSQPEQAGRQAREFFDQLWSKGDPWAIETSALTQREHTRLIELVEGRRYGRVLEIGCGAGAFTRRLATLADSVLAIDIAGAAIERARALDSRPTVEYRVGNVMDFRPRAEGPWDLIVMNEMICFLGWLYPFFNVAWLASELFGATSPRGRMLMANTMYGMEHPLLLPWIIRTYHDLMRNVGYEVEVEEIMRGVKDGVELEILISRYQKPA
jgi:2-polyprenyl-3-methyl-5-hydroxy-6-metoxy-1,4-benzoquinol methylase